MNRYDRNFGTITVEGQKKLHEKKVLVIGAGGLGGFVIEGLARMGIKYIGICDYDVFDTSNLNRQLFATEEVLGKNKASIAKARIKSFDKTIEVKTYKEAFPNDAIKKDIKNYDLVVDCLDSIKTRIALEKLCLKHNKKLIHGAVGGYYGTIAVISEENKIMKNLVKYVSNESDTVDKLMGNPYFTVGVIGSFQVQVAIFVLLGKKYLTKGLYYFDVENYQIDEIVF